MGELKPSKTLKLVKVCLDLIRLERPFEGPRS